VSDHVRCDSCGKRGVRPRFYPAPKGWFFIASVIEDENDTFYVYACSESCTECLWKKGPGERFAATEPKETP
jgi:hypothetical protein